MRVLVVDDDEETLEFVTRALERDGHQVTAAQTPAEAAIRLGDAGPDLIVLDVMLGEASGLDLCATLRRTGCMVPILFLSARGAVNARVEGLDAGGDDYLAKPFALRELLARVRALGRRGPPARTRRLALGAVTLDFDARQATSSVGEVPLTRREWDILRALAEDRGRVVAFDDLLDRVWGEATDGARASMEVIVSRLRKKLDAAAGRPTIRTSRGVGYALELAP
ncbi:MAG: response regulator transcription factor [Myxococcaceae bacterium]|nr:MAG: response regulator transcription factor [Myxococcaceae bacterium]